MKLPVPTRSALALVAIFLAVPVSAQEAPATTTQEAPIASALAAASADVRVYNDHVVTLALSPADPNEDVELAPSELPILQNLTLSVDKA